MSFDLLDVNLWLALEVGTHIHHERVADWFRTRETRPMAFCRITQVGFLRLLTNPKVMREDVKTPAVAWATYHAIRASSDAIWVEEPAGLENCWSSASLLAGGSGSGWTDAYLAGFALACSAHLVTFDVGFQRFMPEGLQLTVIPTLE